MVLTTNLIGMFVYKSIYLLESAWYASGEGLNEGEDIVWDGDIQWTGACLYSSELALFFSIMPTHLMIR